jgi:pyridoxal phosphate enzyme (YggS family)
MSHTVTDSLKEVQERVAAAARRAGREPGEVTIVGVTKAHTADVVSLAADAGLYDLGENYVQEAKRKAEGAPGSIRWHLIGPLQTNKAKYAVRLFHLIHTLDRTKLAKELNKRAKAAGGRQKVLIQVNLTGKEERAGVEPGGLKELCTVAASLENLELLGLMTVPPFLPAEEVRPFFARLREFRDEAASWSIPGVSFGELSMGMSGDFEVAIEEGATIVRVGTAIFGERDYTG